MRLIRMFDKPLLETRFDKSCLDCSPSKLNYENLKHWWEMRSVFNPGAIVKDDLFYILYRAQDFHFISRFGLAVFDPKKEKIVKRPDLPIFELSLPNELQYGRVGSEDARISLIKEERSMYISYVSASLKQMNKQNFLDIRRSRGYGWYDVYTRIIVTNDLESFQDCGLIFSKKSLKDVALFPKKINGYYVFLLRYFPSIQLAFSRNLIEIEKIIELIKPRNGYWDNDKIGIGPPPILTSKGWLCIYHGVDKKGVYRLGYFILDLNRPTKVLFRSEHPILEPEKTWERIGNVPDVVFSNGADVYQDKVYVFYGAADTCIGVASAPLKNFLNF